MIEDTNASAGWGYLVYVRSATGRVWPQWWSELYFGERGDRRASVVTIVSITEDEAELSLTELARRHPLASSGGQP